MATAASRSENEPLPKKETITLPKTTEPAAEPAAETDALADLTDFSKLPIAVSSGQVAASVEEYAGRAVLSMSLLGWIGDVPFRILASEAQDIAAVLQQLREQLA
jgi:hypothetical protein